MPQYNMDAKCPECERVAVLDDDVTRVKCPRPMPLVIDFQVVP